MVSEGIELWRAERVDIQLAKTFVSGIVLRQPLHASVVLENAPSSSVQYKYCELIWPSNN